MIFDVIIIGAGPGGLACAAAAAASGLTTLVLERNHIIGRKVCAGGITCNGLMKKCPSVVSERKFGEQHVFTRLQKACLTFPTPIIATVNREQLGQNMARQATQAGAELRSGCQVLAIDGKNNSLIFLDKTRKRREQANFTFLVGADGSSSLVRRSLGLPTDEVGIGINYQIPGEYPEMHWHMDSDLFANGYAWVFPHKDTASIGAYVAVQSMKAADLKNNLLTWADKNGYPLRSYKASAECINFDFRGWQFGNTFLVGDAAGLASGLTGEGIYSAIISGETVGTFLGNSTCDLSPLLNIIKNHRKHRIVAHLTGKNKAIAALASEMATFCLKINAINFATLEMSH
jgi:menaquinone-9 beta-reductase